MPQEKLPDYRTLICNPLIITTTERFKYPAYAQEGMTNTLRHYATAALAGVAMLAAVGCKKVEMPQPAARPASQQTQTRAYDTSWNLSNTHPSQLTNTNTPFTLKEFIVDGAQYYPAQGRGHEKFHTNTLDFLIYDASRTALVFDDDKRKVELEAQTVYVPTLVTNTNSIPLTKIELKRKDPNVPLVNRHAWSLGGAGKELDAVSYNESSMPFNIKTLVVGGNECYVVRKNHACNPQESLGFYVLPKTGTLRKISPNGDITLQSTRGIYEPVAVSRTSYELMCSPPAQDDNSSQIVPTAERIE